MSAMPRMVLVKLTHGRSVPVSLQGVMHRLRMGDPPMSIPYQVYIRHAWKLELVGESMEQVRTAIMEGEQIQTSPTALPQVPSEVVKSTKDDEVPLWELQVSPEEYIKLYGKKKYPSPSVKRRLALARKLTDGHTE